MEAKFKVGDSVIINGKVRIINIVSFLNAGSNGPIREPTKIVYLYHDDFGVSKWEFEDKVKCKRIRQK